MSETRLALVKGKALKYRVRRHPRARSWKLTVSRDQGLVVTMPPGQNLAGIDELLKECEEWLELNVSREGVWEGPAIRPIATGTEILWLGIARRLEISALSGGRKLRRMEIGSGILKMELPADEVLHPRPALINFLKKKAKEDLIWRVEYWSLITGLVPSKVIVGERNTRWGSCSSQGTLSFCYRLVMAPPAVIDCIVVHELCHLKFCNHGKDFYGLLESFLPDYHQTHNWLTENATSVSL